MRLAYVNFLVYENGLIKIKRLVTLRLCEDSSLQSNKQLHEIHPSQGRVTREKKQRSLHNSQLILTTMEAYIKSKGVVNESSDPLY